jgi:hypothetical protein
MVQLDGVVDEVDFFEILARSMYIHANKKVAKHHSTYSTGKTVHRAFSKNSASHVLERIARTVIIDYRLC